MTSGTLTPCWRKCGYEHGELQAEHHMSVVDSGEITITRADPMVLMDDYIMRVIKAGLTPAVAYEPHSDGDLFKLQAANGTWIYRHLRWLPDHRAHLLAWPD